MRLHKTYICFYCKLHDEKVECQGVWYCPNALCTGPGADWFRRTLKSYQENRVCGTYSVCERELKSKGKRYMLKVKLKNFLKRLIEKCS